jgi:hypothetical protein
MNCLSWLLISQVAILSCHIIVKTPHLNHGLLYVLGLVLIAAMVNWRVAKHEFKSEKNWHSVVVSSSVQGQNVISLPNVTTARAVTDVLQTKV